VSHSLHRLFAAAGAVAILSGCAASPAATPPPVETVSSEGACAAPTIAAPTAAGVVHPGDEIELTVENLVSVCADTPATSSDMPDPNADEAVEEFDVVWLQGDTRAVLATVEPNDGSPFSIAVTVPTSATPGSASILVSTEELSVEVGA
jgi:hypothetical protein